MGTSTAGGMVAGPAAGQPPARPRPFGFARFLLFQSPYILMLLLVLGGITYRAFIGHPIVGYWIMLMPAFCVLCIIGGLRHTKSTKEIVELVLTQVVQWAVFLAALFVLTLGPVRSMLDDDAAALLQLTMLAVATILAGILGHRGITHSALAVIALSLLLAHAGYRRGLIAALAVGYLSHLAADMLTPRGLRLAWPYSRTWGLPICRTGSPVEGIIVVILAGLVLWSTFRHAHGGWPLVSHPRPLG